MNPPVFGYARLSPQSDDGGADTQTAALLRRRIADYCQREGMALELVFIERDIEDASPVRPAWTTLLDGLRRVQALTVLVPSLDHLSADPVLRAEM